MVIRYIDRKNSDGRWRRTKNIEYTEREREREGRDEKTKKRARSCGLNVLAAICLRPQRNDVIYKPLS